jgi:hypothetical protein
MSIDTKLGPLLGKKLFELGTMFTGEDTARTMIVSADILAAVTPPFADTPDGKRLGEFRGWLDNFSLSGELTMAEKPFDKPQDSMLARVSPVEADFWSIRVTAPKKSPGIRAIGAFAGPNIFIALTWERREDIDDFDGEVETAIARWKDLFGDCQPFHGSSVHEYVTTNARSA